MSERRQVLLLWDLDNLNPRGGLSGIRLWAAKLKEAVGVLGGTMDGFLVFANPTTRRKFPGLAASIQECGGRLKAASADFQSSDLLMVGAGVDFARRLGRQGCLAVASNDTDFAQLLSWATTTGCDTVSVGTWHIPLTTARQPLGWRRHPLARSAAVCVLLGVIPQADQQRGSRGKTQWVCLTTSETVKAQPQEAGGEGRDSDGHLHSQEQQGAGEDQDHYLQQQQRQRFGGRLQWSPGRMKEGSWHHPWIVSPGVVTDAAAAASPAIPASWSAEIAAVSADPDATLADISAMSTECTATSAVGAMPAGGPTPAACAAMTPFSDTWLRLVMAPVLSHVPMVRYRLKAFSQEKPSTQSQLITTLLLAEAVVGVSADFPASPANCSGHKRDLPRGNRTVSDTDKQSHTASRMRWSIWRLAKN